MLRFSCVPALPLPRCSAMRLRRCRCAGAGMMWGWGSVRNPGLGIRQRPKRLLTRLQHIQSLGGAHEHLEGHVKTHRCTVVLMSKPPTPELCDIWHAA